MRIITFNANGIRSAARKNFYTWLARQKADVVCIQETKAQREQLQDPVFSPKGYHVFYHDALKKGYSGVAVYSRQAPDRVTEGLGWPEFDGEGRYLRADFKGLSVISLYLPSGSSVPERQAFKFKVLDYLVPFLKKLQGEKREFVLCGDWNIAHKNIDIKNWRGNQKNSGFLPEERAWMDQLFGPLGFVDAFREVDSRDEQYTWWSNRGRARENNVGWRIDYQVVTPGLKARVRRARIYTENPFSDHAPLIMDYEWPLGE